MIITAASITPADSQEPLSLFHEQGLSPSSLPQVGKHPRAFSRSIAALSAIYMLSRGLLVNSHPTASDCSASLCKHAEAVQHPGTRYEGRGLILGWIDKCCIDCRPSSFQQSPGSQQQWCSWWSTCRTSSPTRCLSG